MPHESYGSQIPSLQPSTDYERVPVSQNQRVRWWLGIAIIILITAVSIWLVFSPEWVKWAGQWGYVGAFAISMITSATVILPAPGIAVVIAMGNALDPYILGIVAGVGSAVGELSGYIAGASGRALISDKQRPHFEWIERLTRTYGALILMVLAALPFPLFDIAGIVAGILKMRVVNFLAAVAIGKSIKYIFLILVGVGSLQLLQHSLPVLFR